MYLDRDEKTLADDILDILCRTYTGSGVAFSVPGSAGGKSAPSPPSKTKRKD